MYNSTKNSLKRALALFLAVLLIFTESRLAMSSFAIESIDVVQTTDDDSHILVWNSETNKYEALSLSVFNANQDDIVSKTIYGANPNAPLSQNAIFNNIIEYSDPTISLSDEWAKGLQTIFKNSYPNNTRPFGVTTQEEGYAAVQLAVYIWTSWYSKNTSGIALTFQDLASEDFNTLRVNARNGFLDNYIVTKSLSGRRILTSAIELLNVAKQGSTQGGPHIVNNNTIASFPRWDVEQYRLAVIDVNIADADYYTISLNNFPDDVLVYKDSYKETIPIDLNKNDGSDNSVTFTESHKFFFKLNGDWVGDASGIISFYGYGSKSVGNIKLAGNDLNNERVVGVSNSISEISSEEFSIYFPDNTEMGSFKLDVLNENNEHIYNSGKIVSIVGDSDSPVYHIMDYGNYEISLPVGTYLYEPDNKYKWCGDTYFSISKDELFTLQGDLVLKESGYGGRINIKSRWADGDFTDVVSSDVDLSLYGGIYNIITKNTIKFINDDGVVKYVEKDGVVETIFGTNKYMTSTLLPVGDYVIEEVQAPYGFDHNTSKLNVSMDGVISKDISFDNKLSSPEIMFTYEKDSTPMAETQISATKVIPLYKTYENENSKPDSSKVTTGTKTILTLDKDGKAYENFTYGTYLIEEYSEKIIDSPSFEPFYIFIDENSEKNIRITSSNFIAKINTTISKAGSPEVPLECENIKITFINNLDRYEALTDSKGKASINLPLGEYEIQVDDLPNGLIINGLANLILNRENVSVDGSTIIDLNLLAEEVSGALSISKIGTTYSSVDDASYPEKYYATHNGEAKSIKVFQQTYDSGLVSGATITITAREDIYDYDGTLLYTKDSIVDEFVSEGMGTVMTNIPAGVYNITETSAAPGHLYNKNVYIADLSTGASQNIVIVDDKIDNDMIPTIIQANINVIDSGKPVIGNYSKDFLIGVYTNQRFNTVGAAFGRDSLVGILHSNTEEQLILQPGSYYLKQLGFSYQGNSDASLADVSINMEQYPFVIGNDNYDANKQAYVPEFNNGNIISNSKNNIEVPLSVKSENTGILLYDVDIGVFSLDGDELFRGTIKENEPLKFIGGPGKYLLRQLTNIPGYKKADDLLFRIDVSGEVSPAAELRVSKISVKLYNYDGDQNPLDGSKFVVTKPSGDTIEVSTNEKGFAELTALEIGTYTFKQKSCNLVCTDAIFEFKILPDGSFVGDSVVYNYDKGITIEKKNNEKTESLAGAHIGIFQKDDDGIYNQLFYGITDSHGQIYINNILPGEYMLKELRAPNGYIETTKTQIVNFEDNSTVTFLNESIGIAIRNIDDASGEGIKGSTIHVTSDNGFSQQFISNDKGVFTLDNLQPGTYSYIQLSSPNGYVLNTEKYQFIIGQDRSISGDIVFTNKSIKVNIFVGEKDSLDPVFGAELMVYKDGGDAVEIKTDEFGMAYIPNVSTGTYVIKLKSIVDGYIENLNKLTLVVAGDGTITGDNKLILIPVSIKFNKITPQGTPMEGVKINIMNGDVLFGSYETGVNGSFIIEKLVVGTEYSVIEQETLDGYTIPANTYKFKVKNDGNIDGRTDNIITFENTLSSVVVSNKDTSNNILTGSEIQIICPDSNYNQTSAVDSKGEIKIEGLNPGKCTIQQTKAPKNHTINSHIYEFTLDKHGNVSGITTIINGSSSGGDGNSSGGSGGGGGGSSSSSSTRIFVKDTSGKPIKGVEITFYFNGNKLYTKTTDKNGQVNLTNLRTGTYSFKEVSVPDEFILNENEFSFTFKNRKLEGTNTITNNRKDEFVLKITRKGVSGEAVVGSEMELKNTATKNIEKIKTDADGVVEIKGLKNGTYTVKEVTAAPGYMLDKTEYTFKINSKYEVSGTTDYRSDIVRVLAKVIDNYDKPVYNGQFGLYPSSNPNTPAYTAKSAQDGSLEFKKVVPGSYTIKQISSPNNYTMAGDIIPLNVTSSFSNTANQYVFVNTYNGVDGTQPSINPNNPQDNNNVPLNPDGVVDNTDADTDINAPSDISNDNNQMGNNQGGNNSSSIKDTPKTDDNSLVPYMGVVLIISCIGAIYVVFKLRKEDF